MTKAKVNRRTVGERDNFQCHYCGCGLPENRGTFDHIYPVARGGVHANWNLVWACAKCNSSLGHTLNKCLCDWCVSAVRNHEQMDLRERSQRIETEESCLTHSIADALARAGWSVPA